MTNKPLGPRSVAAPERDAVSKGKLAKSLQKQKVANPRAPLADRSRASWVMGSLLLIALLAVFSFAPPFLPPFKSGILGIIVAAFAGLFFFFLTGELGVSIRGNRVGLGRVEVRATSGAAAFVLVFVWWFSPLSPIQSLDIIRLRVLLVGPEGVSLADANLSTSVGGEPKQVLGGWEIDIPFSKLPADGVVSVFATKESAFLRGSAQVRLGNEKNSSVTIRLMAKHVSVRGIVIDQEGKALEDVRVSVVGYGGEGVSTGPNGGFSLPAHASSGQQVQLYVEKTGYEAASQFHPAGPAPATVVLERTEQ